MKTNITLAFILLLAPTVLFASEYDTYLREVGTLEEELLDQVQAEELLQYQVDYEGNSELFPRGAKYDLDVEGYRSTNASDTHVFVRVGDIPVVLNDVPLDAWFAPYVRDISSIISGYTDESGAPKGLFGPADNVTIAQLAKIIILASDKNTEACPAESLNTSVRGTWAERFVSCSEMYRISIFQDSLLDVNRPATRAEVVASALEAFEIEYENASGTSYDDVPDNYIFKGAIVMASNLGIVSGYKDAAGMPVNLFGPENFVNRAETAKIVALMKQVLRK